MASWEGFYFHLWFGQQGHKGELERNVSQKILKVFNQLNFLLENSTPLNKLIESVFLAILCYFLPWDWSPAHQFSSINMFGSLFLTILAQQNRSLAAFFPWFNFWEISPFLQLLKKIGTQPLGHLCVYTCLQTFEHVIAMVFPLNPTCFDTYFCWCLYFGNPPKHVYLFLYTYNHLTISYISNFNLSLFRMVFLFDTAILSPRQGEYDEAISGPSKNRGSWGLVGP